MTAAAIALLSLFTVESAGVKGQRPLPSENRARDGHKARFVAILLRSRLLLFSPHQIL